MSNSEGCWLKDAVDEVDRTSKWSLLILHLEDSSQGKGFIPQLKKIHEAGWQDGDFFAGTDVAAYQSAVNQGQDMLKSIST